MGSELARKHLNCIAGLDDAERRAAEAEHLLDLEAIVVKSWHIALRSFEHRDVGGEAARGQKRRLKPQRRGMTAMRRFGHGAGIGEQAAGPRCRDTDGVRELIRI